MTLPQLVACLHVKEGNNEKYGGEKQHQQILHCNARNPSRVNGHPHSPVPFMRPFQHLRSRKDVLS